MHYTTNINNINKEKAVLLIDAAVQAYSAFNSKDPATCRQAEIIPPIGYDFIDSWTGVDSIFSKDKTVECYGVVFRSQTAPYTYIFAFRGTDSLLDVLDDLGAELKPFTPHAGAKLPVPKKVEVESGFYDIYSESDDHSKTASMQNQLFKLIDTYQTSDKPINELYITGHSLGSALSELFTLDVALCRPDLVASNYNYACPRVGNSEFVAFYEQQESQQDAVTRTLRFQNIYDKVPCVPPEDMGFQHLPDAFLIAFYEEGCLEKYNLLARHSSANYQAVLYCAA
ncbi:MAG: lipase family protein, partial [Candidatus Electrothrix sp. AUS1_2]|nr:lipase family protein [Candidatus Electrothrix sp. AUS1_2]